MGVAKETEGMTARHFGTASDAGVSDPLVDGKRTRNVRARPVLADERGGGFRCP
jgi:hypothetical protein